jgi:hypothetical protein
LKVWELIELLQRQDPELEVRAEGCDCINPVAGLEVVPESTFLNRTTPEYALIRVDLK